MTSSTGPDHIVVDGSNIATEGRSLPSLAQLNEAVMSFMEEYPDTSITVVVDATFGHRIDKKEAKEFEEGIANNELVAPPAGAVGRGDAFVLSIAQKANASILSNDSFQEFHGDYEWLFDEGRLIGGKPVPHVGWVFVARTPVRGPVSRKATGGKGGSRRGSKKDGSSGSQRGRPTSAAANEPMPVPTSPPPGRRRKSSEDRAEAAPKPSPAAAETRRQQPPKGGDTVNELLPFLEFVEHHPVGTSINGTVDSYSSHGAYVTIGDQGVRGYVPLRLMADPAPTSARKVMRIGESITLVVVSFAPARRSIDCAVPDMAAAAIEEARADALDDGSDGDVDTGTEVDSQATPPAAKTPAKKAAAKKTPAKKTPAKKAAAKKTPAKKTPAKKAPATKAPAKKAPATKAPAKKAPAKKAPAKKAPAKKTPAKKTPAKKAPAKKAPAKKAPAKKAPPKKAAAQKAASD